MNQSNQSKEKEPNNNGKPLSIKEELKQRVLTHQEVQDLFGVKRGAINNWCRKGILKFRRIGGRLYFDALQIDKLLTEQAPLKVPGEGKKRKK